jgi:hypothetical protein
LGARDASVFLKGAIVAAGSFKKRESDVAEKSDH